MAEPLLLPYGENAWLIELANIDEVLAARAAIRDELASKVAELVPGMRTLAVRFDSQQIDRNLLAERLLAISRHAAGQPLARGAGTPILKVPVRYDGADLSEAAAALGVTAEELKEAHQACVWTVAFCGFTPGFGYLSSHQWPFDAPRQASPRTAVPAGSVAIAGQFSAIYPTVSPGGWQLIGTTELQLFDPARKPAALLTPGARVRFAEYAP